jgi:hypothetical protein
VAPTPEKELFIYPAEAEFCVKYDPDLKWIDIFQNQLRSGDCKDGFKKCGNIDGYSKGVCIPSEKDCPITDVKMASTNPDPTKYTEITGETLNLYHTNDPIADPLTELWLGEKGFCVNMNYRSLTDGRKDYVLMRKPGLNDCD